MTTSPAVDVSWLFDQLSDLAGAESVGVVIDADTGSCGHTAASIDLAELLVRASNVPSLRIDLLPTSVTDPTLPLDQREEIDLGTIPPTRRVSAARRMLKRHRAHCGAVLRLQGTKLLLEPYGRLPDQAVRNRTCGGSVRWLLATDQTEHHGALDLPNQVGLHVAIGGMSPGANVNVADVSGFVTLLDALVSLREGIAEAVN